MSDEIAVYTADDGVLMLAVGDDGAGMAMGIDPDTGDVCLTACDVTYRYQGERRRKHTRTAMVDVPVRHMTRWLVQGLHALGVDLGHDVRPTLDEAAIRADEAEKIAAWLDSHAKLVPYRSFLCDLLHAFARDIRAGKHRSTP